MMEKAVTSFLGTIRVAVDLGQPVFVTKGEEKLLSKQLKPFSAALKFGGISDKEIIKLAELGESAAKLDKAIRDNADEKAQQQLQEDLANNRRGFQEGQSELAERYGREMFGIFNNLPHNN